MGLKVVSGHAETIQRVTEIKGSTSRIRTSQIAYFRVSNAPVQMKRREHLPISDGDRVTVCGKQKPHTLEAYAIRNHTTGTVEKILTAGWYVSIVFFFLCGFASIAGFGSPVGVVIGLLFWAMTGVAIFQMLQVNQATRLVTFAADEER